MTERIKKLFSPLFRIAYISMIIRGSKVNMAIKIYQNNKLLNEEIREFDTSNTASKSQLLALMQKLERRNTYCYNSTMLSSINQGAVPTCDPNELGKYGIDTKSVLSICMNEKWSIYGSKMDIDELKERFGEYGGVDFIFPTESIIDHLKKSYAIDEEESDTVMFLLYEKSSATVTVYQKDMLAYSSHFAFDEEEDELVLEDSSSSMSDILEDVLGDDDLENEIIHLENIEDDFSLDSIEDLSDFVAQDGELSLESNDMELSLDGEESNDSFFEETSENDLHKDMLLFNFVKSSINDFYKNDYYESSFISKVVIFDAENGTKGVSNFLKEELYIDSEIHKIKLCSIIADLALKEARL